VKVSNRWNNAHKALNHFAYSNSRPTTNVAASRPGLIDTRLKPGGPAATNPSPTVSTVFSRCSVSRTFKMRNCNPHRGCAVYRDEGDFTDLRG
jgi:hypothetical protein